MIVPEKAIRVANYSNVKKAKVAAIALTSSGQIIAFAHNKRISGNPKKFTQHAEEVLIQKLNKLRAFDRFKNIIILVIRINIFGLSMAKPCNKCQKLLQEYPANILYSGWDQQIYRLKSE